MSSRIDFFEIRNGDEENWDSVCLVKEVDDAQKMIDMLSEHYDRLYYHHVEFVADVNLEMQDY